MRDSLCDNGCSQDKGLGQRGRGAPQPASLEEIGESDEAGQGRTGEGPYQLSTPLSPETGTEAQMYRVLGSTMRAPTIHKQQHEPALVTS